METISALAAPPATRSVRVAAQHLLDGPHEGRSWPESVAYVMATIWGSRGAAEMAGDLRQAADILAPQAHTADCQALAGLYEAADHLFDTLLRGEREPEGAEREALLRLEPVLDDVFNRLRAVGMAREIVTEAPIGAAVGRKRAA